MSMLGGMQITAYIVDEGRLVPLNSSSPREIPARAIWVDVVDPSIEEFTSVAEALGLRMELDDADLSFEVYGHVEVEGDQLMIVMQVEGTDDLTSSKGVLLMSTDRLVTFRSGSVPAIEAAASAAADMEGGAGHSVAASHQDPLESHRGDIKGSRFRRSRGPSMCPYVVQHDRERESGGRPRRPPFRYGTPPDTNGGASISA